MFEFDFILIVQNTEIVGEGLALLAFLFCFTVFQANGINYEMDESLVSFLASLSEHLILYV